MFNIFGRLSNRKLKRRNDRKTQRRGRGEFQQAAADFKKAIELDPSGLNKSANRARALASATLAALKTAVK